MTNKIPLSSIGGQIVHVLREGPPPMQSLVELGIGAPAPSVNPTISEQAADNTYWQYLDWQPS